MSLFPRLALAALLWSGTALAADVHVGINIGIPAPPSIVFPAPPQLVVVPSTPAVRYAPEVDANLFFYRGRYYTLHDGAWFAAPTYSGPWGYVERVRVPRAVLVVPARYYRVPPSRMRRAYDRPREQHRGPRGPRDRHDGHDHGHHGRD